MDSFKFLYVFENMVFEKNSSGQILEFGVEFRYKNFLKIYNGNS